uniref:Galectin n=1 Tax=Centruroides hentzi TaxID=88313 RepID=A0A2I9LP00_9SCOR
MTLLDKLIQKADIEAGLHYRNPSLPCACGLPGGLNIGSKIYIKGIVPNDCSRFSVNLQRGACDETADVYFHFNPRFPSDAGRHVVRNSRYKEEWGKEETDGESPFVPGKPFFMILTSYRNTYEVEVNGDLFCSFTHRENLSLSNVTHLCIEGNLIVQSLHIPVETMPKHLRLAIPGNAKIGDIYNIRGTVNHGAEEWVANIQCGPGKHDDIVLHFNPRFQDRNVVRNTRSDDNWGSEEKKGKMPFEEGEQFYLQIAVSSEEFNIRVNKSPFALFSHRLDVSYASVLYIEGDVNIEDVWIDRTPTHLQTEGSQDGIKNLQKSKFQTFFPELPVISRIINGLKAGNIVVVSGVIDKQPESLAVNLQCDNSKHADIALHYNPRWSSGDDLIVINSRQDEKWGEEVRVKGKFPFSAGVHFEIQILCQNESYSILVNGVQSSVLPHRMELDRVDHLSIEGSAAVHRILVL